MRKRGLVVAMTLAVSVTVGLDSSSAQAKEKGLGEKISDFLGLSTTFKPEKYQLVQWDVVTTRAFRESLRGKRFYFQAVYYGVENNPPPESTVDQWVNIKLCSDTTRESCTAAVVVPVGRSAEVISLPRGTPVIIYGKIGVATGAIGAGNIRMGNTYGEFDRQFFFIPADKVIPE